MKVRVYDIETLKGLFLYMDYDPDTQSFKHFIVSNTVNQLDKMCKWLKENPPDYLVGYNNLSFDSQVIEWILRNNESWFDMSSSEIVNKIYKFSQDVIDNSNHDLPPTYYEKNLSIKQIDLFKIHHFDNVNRRVSLKWLEFMMDMENIEEMPHSHNKDSFTPEEEEEIINYCKNDVLSTYKFYTYTRGWVDSSFYKGKDMLQNRLDLMESLNREFPNHGFSINYSDSKIGDELNKLTYMKLSKINDKQELYKLKKSRKPTKKFTFGDAIPNYVSFKTLPFKTFFDKVRKKPVNLSGKGESYQFTFNGTSYTIAQGGIHSCETERVIEVEKGWILRDCDVGSQHPNAIRKRNLYPKHLGENWNKVGRKNIELRMSYKEKSSENPKYKGLSDMYKLALNAGLN